MRPSIRRSGILPRSLLLTALPMLMAACDSGADTMEEWTPTPSATGTSGQDAAWASPDAAEPLGSTGLTPAADATVPGEADATATQADATIPSDAGEPAPDEDADVDADAEVGEPLDAGDTQQDSGTDAMQQPVDPEPPTTVGQGGTVHATIVVQRGEIFDGANEVYRAGPAVGDGSQREGQKPVFRLEDGATLRNVVLGAPAADGVHTYGDVTLENIVWEDVGEDAMTIKESGTVVLDGGSATRGEDKIFQINAPSTFRVSNFEASYGGKFIRQNGGTDFRVDVYIDRCDISHMDEAIFRTDSDSSTVTMTNTRYSDIGDRLFMGVRSGNITQRDNTAY